MGIFFIGEEEHADEVNKKTWCMHGVLSIVCCPLIEDKDDQISKQWRYEDNFRNKAKEDVQRFLKITIEVWKKYFRKNNEKYLGKN